MFKKKKKKLFFNPDDGKQLKTFGLNILINFFFNLLALYIEHKMEFDIQKILISHLYFINNVYINIQYFHS